MALSESTWPFQVSGHFTPPPRAVSVNTRVSRGLFYLPCSAPSLSPTRCTSVLLGVDAKRMHCGANCKQTGHVVTQKMALQGNAAFVSNYQKSCLAVVLTLHEALFDTETEKRKFSGTTRSSWCAAVSNVSTEMGTDAKTQVSSFEFRVRSRCS